MATIQLSKSSLFSRLQVVNKIISSKPALPIMSSILFELDKDKLHLSGTDYSGQIKTSIADVQSDDTISFCLDPKLLIDALKTLPEQPLILEVNENTLGITIKYHGGKFEMVALPLEDVMLMKVVTSPTEIEIPIDTFLTGIAKTITSSADDELRPVMNGVFIEIGGGQINYVASDGKVLTLIEHHDEVLTESISFILPKKIASILRSIFPPTEKENIKLLIGSNRLQFQYGLYTIVATLIEGRFPNYRSIIPANNDMSVKISVSMLKSALSRVLVFSSQASRLISLNLMLDSLIIKGQDIDYSTCADEKIECEYNGATFKIGFNGNYLNELLASISCSEVVLTFSDPSRAALLYPVDNSDANRMTCLIMPMSLGE